MCFAKKKNQIVSSFTEDISITDETFPFTKNTKKDDEVELRRMENGEALEHGPSSAALLEDDDYDDDDEIYNKAPVR